MAKQVPVIWYSDFCQEGPAFQIPYPEITARPPGNDDINSQAFMDGNMMGSAR